MEVKIFFRKFFALLLNIFVWLFSITCVFPFIWIVYSSLKTNREFSLNIISLPLNPQIINYISLIKDNNMYVAFFNSTYISLFSVAVIILIGFITAYTLSRFEFKGRTIIYFLFLSGMLIPRHSLLVPVFIFFRNLGLYNTRYTLFLPYIAFGLPMTIFLMESFIKTVPIEIEESAVIDGCNIFDRLFKIILPVCKPVVSTTLILSFLGTWNEFPFALILIRSTRLKTLPLWLTNFHGQYSTDYTQLMAALVIASLPVIFVYLVFSKRVVQGMTAGAVKG